ncbi:hypothetical protein [Chitinophaga sp. CF418]|uniref:hypothetical protein n=1 Tax=Chitinophaga sp. CF418 TaxID=1855287 RepID=UPI0009147167|nr:hypothetical protein [Chitinophaga sp. CF418]SHN29626.1 hypothetical protein SAMN05216311_108229 [Chitinophaga sp. CF418]
MRKIEQKNKAVYMCAFFVISAFISSCSQKSKLQKSKPQKVENTLYSYQEIKMAWKTKDSITVARWIDALDDTLVSNNDYYSRLAWLGSISKFYYGNMEIEDRVFKNYSSERKILVRKNTAAVYKLYKASSLFMKNVDLDVAFSIQENYWNDSSLFTSWQLSKIKFAIDSIAKISHEDGSEN